MTPELQLLLAIVLLFIVVIIGYKAEKRDNKALCGLCINATIDKNYNLRGRKDNDRRIHQ